MTNAPVRMSCFILLALLTSAASAATVVEAEKATIRTEGGRVGNGLWNLWSNGRLGEYLRPAGPGTYQIEVRAQGSPAGGVWPRMALMVDGRHVALVTVESSKPEVYRFSAELPAEACEVCVAFLNDAVVGTEDRNLLLDRITITPPTGVADPAVADGAEIARRMQRNEDRMVQFCDEQIEKNRKSDAVIQVLDAAGKPVAGVEVRVKQTRHDFLFGCNIYRFDRYKTPERNAAYKRRFAELFNYATTGFYWRSYEWERGKPQYDYTDQVVAWCRERGIRLKGHPLLWDYQAGVPRWSDGQPAANVQRQRVLDVMRRYADKIEFWEVVNEPSHVRAIQIDEPYRWARQADPEAYLIVNDYYVMADGYPPFFQLLKESIDHGVPFDGIGIQAHEPRTMRFPLDRCWEILDKYATLGKDLHITEFTPASSGQPITGSHISGVWDEAAQADYAVKFYRLCFAHPAVVAVTWWDLCDDGSWLPGGGMLRADLSPKPVYEQLKSLIHTKWKTQTAGTTDADGRFRFRGFHGTYRVIVKGRVVEEAFHLETNGENQLIVDAAVR